MDEKEIVSRAIHFGSPPRIGLRYTFDPEQSDIVDFRYSEANKSGASPGEDEWGCVWSKLGGRIESSWGQVTEHPLAIWDDYEPPDPLARERFEGFELDAHPTKYRAGSFPFPIFNRLMFLRGTRNLMRDFYRNPSELRGLAEKVLIFARGIVESYGELGLDGVWFGDDLASQRSILFSPEIWRDFVRPWYVDLFGWAHQAGLDVIFHTCGQTRFILEDLVEMGADALNLNQPELLGIDWMVERLCGRVSLFCPVDSQLINFMTPEEVRENAIDLVNRLSGKDGGFVALCDEGWNHGTVPMSNLQAIGEAFETFRR